MAILRSIGKGNSFFSFIEDYCLSPFINLTVHRLCSLMRKMNAETAIVEDIDPKAPDIAEECDALRVRHIGNIADLMAFRITFITEKLNAVENVLGLDDDKFLASVIIINFKVSAAAEWTSYLFHAIVTIPKMKSENPDKALLNNYIHVFKTFPCELNISGSSIRSFNIVGNYFTQQNSATSVCGHAALCMTLNNLADFGRVIAPQDINRAIGVDHSQRKFGPGSGLSLDEIRSSLTHFGLKYIETNFFNSNFFEYNEKIYRYVESGYPVLLIFTTKDELHVITVVGHTLNTDLWRPEAEILYTKASLPQDQIRYRPASAWVDHFIIHDDNFGMYRCLPVESLKRITIPKYDPNFRAVHAVMVIPSDVQTPSYEAELASVKVTKDILNQYRAGSPGKLNYWLGQILKHEDAGLVSTVRTMLLKKTDYAGSLNLQDFTGCSFTTDDKDELLKDLPDRFWLSEITLPDLYTANKTKIVDFFYPSNLPAFSNINEVANRWIQIRFPEVLAKRSASGISVYNMTVSSHYPLFRLNSGMRTQEW
jgi:hypothetical protein